MTPTAAERDALFRAFARALFKRDLDALYETVTPDFTWSTLDGEGRARLVTGRAAVAAQIAAGAGIYESQRFTDVVYHHLPEVSFMTFRVSEVLRGSGEQREAVGVERYTFRDGRIALKDVYRKPVAA